MTKSQSELKLEKDQYSFFEKEWGSKWKGKFSDQDGLLNTISNLAYDHFYHVNNAFGKLDKALQICEFLNILRNQKPAQDTEKIIITTLVSCAEAVYRINKPKEVGSENLVKGFFKPAKSKIDYKIRGNYNKNCESGKCEIRKVFGSVEVLYLVRNDYIHNGNFTGVFFRNENSKKHVYNLGSFYYSERDSKSILIQANSECCLTYKKFLKIFLEAFISNIQTFCKKHSS